MKNKIKIFKKYQNSLELVVLATFILLFINTLTVIDTNYKFTLNPLSTLYGTDLKLRSSSMFEDINNSKLISLINNNDTLNARDLCYKILEKQPYSVLELLECSRAFAQLKNFAKANSCSQLALSLAPNNNLVRLYYAEILLVCSDFESSLNELTNLVLMKDKNLSLANFEIARDFSYLHKFNLALNTLNKNPENSDSYKFLYLICDYKQNHNEKNLEKFINLITQNLDINSTTSLEINKKKFSENQLLEYCQINSKNQYKINSIIKYSIANKIFSNLDKISEFITNDEFSKDSCLCIYYYNKKDKQNALKYFDKAIDSYLDQEPKFNIPNINIYNFCSTQF